MELYANQNLLDDVCNFLQMSGWSFGWRLVMEDGEKFWRADALAGIFVSLLERNNGSSYL